MANSEYMYQPQYAIHPGEYILELLDAKGMKQTELALRLGITTKHLSNLINGKVMITPQMAVALQNVFGNASLYWLSLQATYDMIRHSLAMAKEYELHKGKYDDWLAQFNYEYFVTEKYFEEIHTGGTVVDRINNLLLFFGCADIDSWTDFYFSGMPASYRIVGASAEKLGNATVWIKRGQLLAQQDTDSIPKYSRVKFKAAILEIRELTNRSDGNLEMQMKTLCHMAGVNLLFVEEIPGSGMYGAAYWINKRLNPCIQLSQRHLGNKDVWIAINHEATHIYQEQKRVAYLDCDLPDAAESA